MSATVKSRDEDTDLLNRTLAFLASGRIDRWAFLILIVGIVAIATPTLIYVANTSWSTEQGGHGPIVLMTGLWLLVRLWPEAIEVARPAPLSRVIPLLALFLPAYCLARITQIVELDGYLMYACLLVTLYAVIGGEAMRRLWFPLLYLTFIFPPPDTVVATITIPLKMGLSQFAITVLRAVGYPVGGEGVTIYVGQYELLVAAACSGLNSIIALGAISLFYIYVRHQAEWGYALLLTLITVPVALLANFVRVSCLILLTYYAGEATAQGFLHNFAGILMFAVALASIFAIDALLKPLWNRLTGNVGSVHDAQRIG